MSLKKAYHNLELLPLSREDFTRFDMSNAWLDMLDGFSNNRDIDFVSGGVRIEMTRSSVASLDVAIDDNKKLNNLIKDDLLLPFA